MATLLCLALVFVPQVSAVQKDVSGTNAGETLRIYPSAISTAMGDAYTAAAEGDIESLWYNPAGLGFPKITEENGGREIGAMYQNLVLDIGQGALGYVHPINDRNAFGLSVSYFDYGATRRTVVSGNTGAYNGDFQGQDLMAGLSYGARLSDEFSYGLTAKVFSSEIDNATATAFGIDFGGRWSPNEKLALGASVLNVGTQMQYDYEKERMPIVFRGGAMWKPVKGLRLVADLEKEARAAWSGHAGAEYTFADLLSVRAGWDGSLHVDNGLTLGGGVKLKGLSFDYAFIPFGEFGNNHRAGMKYRF